MLQFFFDFGLLLLMLLLEGLGGIGGLLEIVLEVFFILWRKGVRKDQY